MMNCFVVITAILLAAAAPPPTAARCDYEAVFNFGDSNSDTGGFYSAFPPQSPPDGVTYFKKPAGRISDGRLVIDFLAQALGLPLLSPYLKSVGSDFQHGANFAIVGAAVRRKPQYGASPFSLEYQLRQFKEFKLQVEAESNSSGTPLPGPGIFGKSLYTIYIGQNDFTGPNSTSKDFLQEVVSVIANTTKEIYTLGGRTFLVFNLAPLGCYPFRLSKAPSNSSDKDSAGCLTSDNSAVDEYNTMLKAALSEQARKQLPADAKVILVDSHAVLLRVFNNPTFYGFPNATAAACSGEATVCSDPQHFVSWDGTHLTEAANKIVADGVLTETYFDPPFPLSKYCDINPPH
ncbi:hypothetical protein ACS0TY_019653 [Phlomoides rotata]